MEIDEKILSDHMQDEIVAVSAICNLVRLGPSAGAVNDIQTNPANQRRLSEKSSRIVHEFVDAQLTRRRYSTVQYGIEKMFNVRYSYRISLILHY